MRSSVLRTDHDKSTKLNFPITNKSTLMSMRDLQAETGKSRPWVYKKLREDPKFPRPVKLGDYNMAWIRSEFDSWITSLERYEPNGLSTIDRRKMGA